MDGNLLLYFQNKCVTSQVLSTVNDLTLLHSLKQLFLKYDVNKDLGNFPYFFDVYETNEMYWFDEVFLFSAITIESLYFWHFIEQGFTD